MKRGVVNLSLLGAVALTLMAAKLADGHGMLLDPPGRSSMWRYFPDQPTNYNDNGINCGGYGVQYNGINKGRCGECGDEWSIPRPRPNDEGGMYWTGKIAQSYKKGNLVRTTVKITANHKGYFEFRLCPKQSATELATQACLDQHLLQLHDGTTKFYIGSENKEYYPLVQLPNNITCENCVFQWWWRAGNNWGTCADGTNGEGCGDQESFVNCADIAIIP